MAIIYTAFRHGLRFLMEPRKRRRPSRITKGMTCRNGRGRLAGQLIAGAAYGLSAAARTHSPLFIHLELEAGARAEIPSRYAQRALYIATGAVEIGGERYGSGQMLVLASGASSFRAVEPTTAMVLGGEPVGERFLFWNFVSSSKTADGSRRGLEGRTDEAA
ncbi:pirin-like C-terminal cupin domain-containing protein [Komagataeibacter rhaeticus]|nr:pirin-like C-terminal cupin domain-containing protein [Komagataeibacter rhaeticus]